MTPFGHAHPGVLIRPDKVARDWEQIGEVLAELTEKTEETPVEDKEEASAAFADKGGNKQRYAEAFNRFIAPLQQREFKNWFFRVVKKMNWL